MLPPSSSTPPADLQQAWEAGARALREGRARDALSEFSKITALGQAGAPVWAAAAVAHRALGDAAGEREALKTALRVDPRNLHALLMMADHFAEAGDTRAADSYYNAFSKLAEATGDPALKGKIDRALRARADYAASYAARLGEGLRGHDLARPGAARMRRALDLMLGKSELFLQQPRYFYFPELPNIEYAERQAFPWLDRVEAATDAIRAELLQVLEQDQAFAPYIEAEPDRPLFDDQGKVGNPNWSAFYLWKAGAPVPENAARCPATMAALSEAPLCRIPGRTPSIFFSLLRPGMHITPHHGFMNARYVCHLPLIVPGDCAMRVGSQTRAWAEGEACVFDDSIEHEAWNRHPDRLRVVLIFDIWRPELSADERDFIGAVMQAVDSYGTGDED
jgi:aspartyl/asparaginyl beta-hydroxylase (cupin superfamily)